MTESFCTTKHVLRAILLACIAHDTTPGQAGEVFSRVAAAQVVAADNRERETT